MTRAAVRFALLAGLACPAAFGQFGLFVTESGGEPAVGASYDYGAAAPGETLAVRFRIRNISGAAASLTGLVAAGSGFGLTNGPALPAVLPAGAVADFTVEFRASYLGAYSAALVSDGISVLLTARVDVRLTY